MTTFALVHGAWHGAWCWELLIPELEARGHTAIAMDLPIEDRGATFDDYADAVCAAARGASDLVVVGHSLAGMVIPLVALKRPVRMLVFLCALMPERVGDDRNGEPATHPDGAFDALEHHPDGSHSWPELDGAVRTLYQDCNARLAEGAFTRLRRQQTALWDLVRPMPRWPEAEMASVHCSDDRAIRPEWCRWIASHRLGVDSIELPGGHSPMLSRPAALADALVAAAQARDAQLK